MLHSILASTKTFHHHACGPLPLNGPRANPQYGNIASKKLISTTLQRNRVAKKLFTRVPLLAHQQVRSFHNTPLRLGLFDDVHRVGKGPEYDIERTTLAENADIQPDYWGPGDVDDNLNNFVAILQVLGFLGLFALLWLAAWVRDPANRRTVDYREVPFNNMLKARSGWAAGLYTDDED